MPPFYRELGRANIQKKFKKVIKVSLLNSFHLNINTCQATSKALLCTKSPSHKHLTFIIPPQTSTWTQGMPSYTTAAPSHPSTTAFKAEMPSREAPGGRLVVLGWAQCGTDPTGFVLEETPENDGCRQRGSRCCIPARDGIIQNLRCRLWRFHHTLLCCSCLEN